MRIFKGHPILKLVNSYIIDSPQPSNLSYVWNFGSLLAFCLVIQIITGVTLAMHYNPSILEAFNSIEHIMRDVTNGWLIRYLHSNTASAFFFLVYLHIGKGLYYGSYRAPRTLVWTLGTFIFIIMIVTAFLGFCLSPRWFKFKTGLHYKYSNLNNPVNNNNNNNNYNHNNHNNHHKDIIIYIIIIYLFIFIFIVVGIFTGYPPLITIFWLIVFTILVQCVLLFNIIKSFPSKKDLRTLAYLILYFIVLILGMIEAFNIMSRGSLYETNYITNTICKIFLHRDANAYDTFIFLMVARYFAGWKVCAFSPLNFKHLKHFIVLVKLSKIYKILFAFFGLFLVGNITYFLLDVSVYFDARGIYIFKYIYIIYLPFIYIFSLLSAISYVYLYLFTAKKNYFKIHKWQLASILAVLSSSVVMAMYFFYNTEYFVDRLFSYNTMIVIIINILILVGGFYKKKK